VRSRRVAASSTLESEPKHAEVARANVARAGLAEQVEVRLGRALDTLPKLAAEAATRSTSRSSTPTSPVSRTTSVTRSRCRGPAA
jgi:ATP phosphoribosyltransferase regulatory subunit HisZ